MQRRRARSAALKPRHRKAAQREVSGGSVPYCTKPGCGRPVVYTNENRCEDCWADDQQRYGGEDRSVRLFATPDTRPNKIEEVTQTWERQ